MHKLIKSKLGKDLKKLLRKQAKQEVLTDLAEDLMLQALDPANEEVSLSRKLNIAKEIYRNNPDLKMFDKDNGNKVYIINYSNKALDDAKKELKSAKKQIIEVKKFG